jgi:hypothetical protein
MQFLGLKMSDHFADINDGLDFLSIYIPTHSLAMKLMRHLVFVDLKIIFSFSKVNMQVKYARHISLFPITNYERRAIRP